MLLCQRELSAKSNSRSACAISRNKPTLGARQHQQPISSRPTRSSSPLLRLAEHSLTLTSILGSLVASYRTNLLLASRLRKNVWSFASKPAIMLLFCVPAPSHFHFRDETPRHRASATMWQLIFIALVVAPHQHHTLANIAAVPFI